MSRCLTASQSIQPPHPSASGADNEPDASCAANGNGDQTFVVHLNLVHLLTPPLLSDSSGNSLPGHVTYPSYLRYRGSGLLSALVFQSIDQHLSR